MRNTFVVVALSALAKLEKIMSGIAAAAIGAGITAVGSLFGASKSYGKARKLAADQNAYNLALWEKENAYNTPAAQKQRLIDAGLNPALMYEGGGVQNTASTPQPAVDDSHAADYIAEGSRQSSAAMANVAVQALQIEKMKKDLEQQQLDIDRQRFENENFLPLQLEGMQYANEIAKSGVVSAQADATLKSIAARVGLKTEDLQVEKIRNEVEIQEKSIAQLIAETDFTKLKTDAERLRFIQAIETYAYDVAVKKWAAKQAEMGVKLTQAEIDKAYSDIALNEQYAMTSNIQGQLFGAQANLVSFQDWSAREFYESDKAIRHNQALLTGKQVGSYTAEQARQWLGQITESASRVGYIYLMSKEQQRGAYRTQPPGMGSWIQNGSFSSPTVSYPAFGN